MKLDINNSQHAALLARYLCGEMAESECNDFEGLVNSEEENVKLVEIMKKQWKVIGGKEEPAVPDSTKAWDRLHSRLEADNLIPDQKLTARNFSRANYIRIAALILVLICTGAILFWSANRSKPSIEMVRLNTLNEENTLIKTLADGSVIYIGSNSLFSFPKEFAPDQRNVELKGEAFFDIALNPAKPFIIETEEAIIEVLGTAFNVRTSNGQNFELIVDRGKVKVTMKNQPGKSEYVIAGEKVTTVNNQIVKSKSTISEHPSWYKHRMHFKDEPLHAIFKVLNRNFNTTFASATPGIGNRKLTVTFDNESVETMTELICLSLNLKSQVKNDSIVLSESRTGDREN